MINTQVLLKMADLAEKQGVNMGLWFMTERTEHPCGTAGCLVGTDLCAHSEAFPELKKNLDVFCRLRVLEKRYGVTQDEFGWLFMDGPTYVHCSISPTKHRLLTNVTTEQAVGAFESSSISN